MAKGGSMKGHNQSHNNGSRGRTYALLVLLAFGAAIFGVIILHKLRERRILNLHVKDKETQLIDLKLLLQKEREHMKEAKRQVEDMKSKMQRLRTQKRDLESRISEMKSTISSLKDEQRIIEVALEEKQDEIKMLREKHNETHSENSQVKSLTESLRQKEAEVKDLKRRLESPVKVWSVSADDPSNPPINFTTKAAGRTEASGEEAKELPEPAKRDDQNNSTENIDRSPDESALKRNEATRQGEDRGQAQAGERSADWKRNTGEQESQELTTAQKDAPGNRSTIFQTKDGQRGTPDRSTAGENFLEEKRNNSEDASMGIINHSGQVKKQSNEVGVVDGQVQKQSNEVGVVDATNWKEHGKAIEGEQGNIANSQGNEQGSRRNYKGGLKLEMNDNPKSIDTSSVDQEYIRKTEGKIRRIIAESKVTESGRLPGKRSAGMRNRKLFRGMLESETNERVRGAKQEKQEYQQDKNMDLDRRKESGSEDHTIDMTDKTQEFKDLEEIFGKHIRSEQEQKPEMGRQRTQDDSSNLNDVPPHKTLPNPKESASAKESSQAGMKSYTNEIIEKGQEIELKNTEPKMPHSSWEVPTKKAVSKVNGVSKEASNKNLGGTAQSQDATGNDTEHQEHRQADNLYKSLEHAEVAERDEKADELQVENDQETGEVIYQKPNRSAQPEEENNTIIRDPEQRLAGNLDSSSTHGKNAATAVQDGKLDIENDEETEDADLPKGFASNFEEEGEDKDQTDEPAL